MDVPALIVLCVALISSVDLSGSVKFDKKNCLVGAFQSEIWVTYNKTVGPNKTEDTRVMLSIPENAKVSVSCSPLVLPKDKAVLEISWPGYKGAKDMDSLSITWTKAMFSTKKSKISFSAAKYTFIADEQRFPNATVNPGKAHAITLFPEMDQDWSWTADQYLQCDTTTNLLSKNNRTLLVFKNVTIFAFSNGKTASHCLADEPTASTTLAPSKDDVVYVGKDGKTILALMDTNVTFKIQYEQKSGNKTETGVATFSPKDFTVSAKNKSKDEIDMTVTWKNNSKEATWVLSFTKDKDSKLMISTANLTFTVDEGFGFQKNATNYGNSTTVVWKVDEDITTKKAKTEGFWQCDAEVSKTKKYNESSFDATISMTDTQIEVFQDIKSATFQGKTGTVCAADPTPTPSPVAPTEGQWNVTDKDTGVTCIMLKSGITLHLWYKKNETIAGPVIVDVPKNATVNKMSTCGKESNATLQTLVLDFYKTWNLTIKFTDSGTFTKKTNGDYWMGYQITLFADYSQMPGKFNGSSVSSHTYENDVNETDGSGSLTFLGASQGKSLVCNAGLNKTIVGTEEKLSMDFDRVQVQAFANSTKFNTAEHCSADEATSDLVPIIVGACLAALVVIVLVAYLIGRARAKRTGYQSV